MPKYRKSEKKITAHPTKWDGFTIVVTGEAYRHQKGSGRSQVLVMAKNNMPIGDWCKLTAKEGFDSDFSVDSLFKHHTSVKPAYRVSDKDNQGRTIAEVKAIRDETPERKAKREQKAKDKVERIERRKVIKAAKGDKKAKQDAKAKKRAETKAAKAA